MFQKSKLLLITGIGVVLVILGLCGYKVHTLSNEQQQIRADYATANNITFGLLSVSQWRDQLETVISQEIQNFDLTPEQRKDLQKEIEDLLNSLIDKAVATIEQPKKTFKGKISKFAFNIFIDPKAIHEQVPSFAKQIITQVENPASKKRLRGITLSKMQQLGQQTYDSSRNQQLLVINTVYKKYNVANAAAFDTKSTSLLTSLRRQMYNYAFGMISVIAIILSLWWFLRNKPQLHVPLYLLSVVSALILLLVGISTTMIELDARIKSLDFKLIGTTISFNNQVLFFQSKSILDVVRILIDTGKWDMIIVGVLILCFSVLFPIAKLSSTCIHLLGNKKYATNKFVGFFAFKSGKWSMADVMVVAIMMTYIGFNGVLESQLSSLNIQGDTITSITTNNTSLQPGYIVFVGYVLYGLISAQILKRVSKYKEENI